jgi:hypothetical protein
MLSTKNELVFLTRGQAAKMLKVDPHSVDKMRKANKVVWKQGQNQHGHTAFFYSYDSVKILADQKQAAKKSEKAQKKLSFATADRQEIRSKTGNGIVATAAILYNKFNYLISIQQRIGDNAVVADLAWQARASKAKKDFSGYDETCEHASNPMEALRLLVLKLARKHKIKS